mgnify:CR=1 FL=1
MEDTKIITMPVIALRGLTMLPEMTISFDISRKKSIAAVEKAMVSDQRVCLVAQKDPEIQDPSLEQLYHIGTVSYIKQLVKMPGGIVRVMAEGQERAELLDLDSTLFGTYGRQEGEGFNFHYQAHGIHYYAMTD